MNPHIEKRYDFILYIRKNLLSLQHIPFGNAQNIRKKAEINEFKGLKIMATRRKARLYESQEMYAKAMNGMRKNDGINRFYRPAGAEEGHQGNIGLLFRLFRRINCLEQELTAIRQQLNETACKGAAERYAVLHSQWPSSQPLHRDGSRRKTAYLILEEDLIPIKSSARQILEEPVHSSGMRRAVDEL